MWKARTPFIYCLFALFPHQKGTFPHQKGTFFETDQTAFYPFCPFEWFYDHPLTVIRVSRLPRGSDNILTKSGRITARIIHPNRKSAKLVHCQDRSACNIETELSFSVSFLVSFPDGWLTKKVTFSDHIQIRKVSGKYHKRTIARKIQEILIFDLSWWSKNPILFRCKGMSVSKPLCNALGRSLTRF